MSDLKELSLEMKKAAHGGSSRMKSFEPLSDELKRAHTEKSSLRETMVPGKTLSKVLPSIFIKKIEVDNNPDSSAFLDDTTANPHISRTQVVGKNKDGSLIVKRTGVSISSINNLSGTGTDNFITVGMTVSVKQLFDDDDLVYDIIKTLGMDKYLKIKIFAVINNPTYATLAVALAKKRPDLLDTVPDQGLYVIGGRTGLPIPQDHSKGLSAISNEFEMSIDGSIVKNSIIKKSFVLPQTPESMSIYCIAYYDIFEGSDFDKEMEANLGALLDDANLSKILIGRCKSEIIFKDSELLNEAAVFLQTPPAVSNIGEPYMGEILEVRDGLFAIPKQTTTHRTHGGHSHFYYVDSQGNGWTNMHTDRQGRKHIHMISSFRLSPAGKYDDLEEKFTPHQNTHSHNLPIAASNSLYKKMIPIDYIIDNRSAGSVGNLKLSLDKSIEDTFSFLSIARRRSNIIKPMGGSNELSVITTRESKKRYLSSALYSSDASGNCRFSFALDFHNWASDNSAFGKYIADKSRLPEYVKISSLKVFRKKINHYDYARSKNLNRTNLSELGKNPEQLVCVGTKSGQVNERVVGYEQNASIVEYTPAGTQKSNKRFAKYFMVADLNYTATRPSRARSSESTGRVDNERHQLGAGIYAYSIELSVIDNSVEYFTECQRALYTTVKKLEDYIFIGSRKENHSGVTREFTKSFKTKVMDDLAKEIVHGSMKYLRRVFLDKSGKTMLTSEAGFSTRAGKIYTAIRPKSGSLFAAERYLKELRGIISYLRGITRIDEVGKYGSQIRGVNANNAASGRFSANPSSRLKTVKFAFKECFHKNNYLDGAASFVFNARSDATGLSSVTSDQFERSLSSSPESPYILVEPRLVSSKLSKFKQVPVDERFIRKAFYGNEKMKLLSSSTQSNTFQIVDNSHYLKKQMSESNIEATSLLTILGGTSLDEEIESLRSDGFFSKKERPNVRELRRIVSGEELVSTLHLFKRVNTKSVHYLAGFKNVKNSFVPSFKLMTKAKMRALLSEGRPILCRISTKYTNRSYNPDTRIQAREMQVGASIFNEYFLVVNSVTEGFYSPTRPSEMSSLEDRPATYDPEIVTTNPDVRSGIDGPAYRPGGDPIGPSSSGSSGGGY